MAFFTDSTRRGLVASSFFSQRLTVVSFRIPTVLETRGEQCEWDKPQTILVYRADERG